MTDVPMDEVNESVQSEWMDDSTPFERVWAVIKRTYDPQSVSEIADRARTTPTTTRTHLQQLEDSGVVATTSASGRNATLYERSTESLILEQARDILDTVERDELIVRIDEIEADLRAYREEFGVESPEAVPLQDMNIDQRELRNWRTTRRNLIFAQVALVLDEAEAAIERSESI